MSLLKSTNSLSFLKKITRKKWFKILKPFLIASLFVLIIYLLTIVGFLEIKEIETVEEINNATEVSNVFNKYYGEGYFFLNLDDLNRNIKNSSRYVKDVSSEKIFPNKIRVSIEEYVPKYYFEYDGICNIISEEGLILEFEEEYINCGKDTDIMLQSNQNILTEENLIFDTEVYQVVKVLEVFNYQIEEIRFERNILRFLDEEREFVLEVNEEYKTQLARLYIVLEKINIERLDFSLLDLRFNRPVMQIL